MYVQLATATTYLADLSDPTDGGMLIKLINFALAALMVAVVGVGAWRIFKVWAFDEAGTKVGKGSQIAGIRTEVIGILVVEACLGGVMWVANYGSSLFGNFT